MQFSTTHFSISRKRKIAKSNIIFVFLLSFSAVFAQADDEVRMIVQNGHYQMITDLAFLPNGEHLASSSEDKTIRIWDVPTGKEMQVLLGHKSGINKIAASPDGEYLVSGGNADDKSLIFWNWKNGEILHRMENVFPKGTSSLAISPNGKLLAAGTYREIKVWDAITKNIKYRIGGTRLSYADLPIKGIVESIAFSPNGSLIAIGIDNGEVQVRYANTGKLRHTLNTKEHQGKTSTIRFSDDGQFLYTGGATDNILTWEMIRGQLKGQFRSTNLEYPCPCSFSADTKEFTAICSGTLKIQNVEVGNETHQKQKLASDNKALIYHPKKSHIVALSGKNKKGEYVIQLVNNLTGHLVTTMKGYSDAITSLEFSPDSKSLAAGSRANPTRIWNLVSGKGFESYSDFKPKLGGIIKAEDNYSTVHFSLSGKTLLKSDKSFLYSWNVADKKLAFKTRRPVKEKNGFVVSPYGKTIFQISNGTRISVYDIETQKFTKLLQGPNLVTRSLLLNPEGKILYSGGFKEIKRWETDSLTELPKFILPDYAWEMKLNPDNTILIVQEGDSKVVLRDIETGSEIKQITDEGKNIAISPDGTFLATSFGDIISLWDMKSYELVGQLSGHQNTINCLTFSPDGKFLASGSDDASIKLWDYKQERLIATLIGLNKQDYLITTPQNYYMASAEGIKGAAFRLGNKMFPFREFDLLYNRPEVVLQSIGFTEAKTIQAYGNQYRTRLKKLGFESTHLQPEFHLPTIKLIGHAPPLSSQDRYLAFKVLTGDDRYRLHRLHVAVNGIPLYGMKGLDITARPLHRTKTLESIDLMLSDGMNNIEVYVQNEKGVNSLKETFEVLYTGEKNIKTLHLIAIGISKYENTKMNLTYSVKDAKDIAALFKNSKDKFDEVIIHSLTNNQVTLANLKKLQETLQKTKTDDRVLVYFSGHALYDYRLDYYLAMHNTSFTAPARNSLLYSDLESLLDNIPARRKALFLDLCHSEEVDNEDLEVINDGSISQGHITMKKFPKIAAPKVGLSSSYEVSEKTVLDTQRDVGTNVMATVSGVEYALEGAKWKNNVFAFAFISGLSSGGADFNKNGEITISELQKYLNQEIPKLTQNKQKSVTKIISEINDFRIW